MDVNTLALRFERAIRAGQARETTPYLVLELPFVEDPEQTELGLFFEEREPGEEQPRFKGVEQKCGFIDEHKSVK